MKWVLVLIILEGVHPCAVQGGVYETMIDCFTARERFMGVLAHNPPNQAVCVRTASKAET